MRKVLSTRKLITKKPDRNTIDIPINIGLCDDTKATSTGDDKK